MAVTRVIKLIAYRKKSWILKAALPKTVTKTKAQIIQRCPADFRADSNMYISNVCTSGDDTIINLTEKGILEKLNSGGID